MYPTSSCLTNIYEFTLDIIASAVSEFDGQPVCGSNNQGNTTKIDQFYFTAVVSAFDQACATGATCQHWNATQSLSAEHIDDGEDSVLGSSAFKDVNIAACWRQGRRVKTLIRCS